jgi:hypothetical protein
MTTETGLVIPSQAEISNWSDDKRKDFVGLFSDRTVASYRITLMVGQKMVEAAEERKIFASRHKTFLANRMGGVTFHELLYPTQHQYYNAHYNAPKPVQPPQPTTQRTDTELSVIATERANIMLDELPSVQAAMKIIQPEVVTWMMKRDVLKADCEKLITQLDDSEETVKMSDHRDMKVGAFLDMVQAKDKHRQDLVEKLNKFSEQGRAFDEKIHKVLYKGIPGLSDAVMDCVVSLYESATAMTEMNRRVEEKIQYGDSDAAIELLKGFEKDEKTVSVDISARLKNALDHLKVGKTGRRVAQNDTKKLGRKGNQHA